MTFNIKKIMGSTPEERKRFIEFLIAIFVSILLFNLSRLETRLFFLGEQLAENREFFTTLVYFALINLNVILILLLSFLLFRNLTKLIIERRRGVLGSKLKTKLVITFMFFALAPTILLFYISSQYIAESFESWFSEKVQVIIEKTREAGSQIYTQDQKRLQGLARLAAQKINFDLRKESREKYINVDGLRGFDQEYGLNYLNVFTIDRQLLWTNHHPEKFIYQLKLQDGYFEEALKVFSLDRNLKSHSRVSGIGEHDVVLGAAPIRDPIIGRLLGVVITEVRFESQILRSVEKILSDFADLKPQAKLIRLSYMILMIMVGFLIVFSAMWLGFYVAREITRPLQNLAEATREVALGNYNVTLQAQNTDETGQLIHAFNRMTKDIREHIKNIEKAQISLQKTNLDLDEKSQNLEIVLRHITAGVLSLDSHLHITSINAAAEKLLDIEGQDLIGKSLQQVLRPELFKVFWTPIQDSLEIATNFHGQINLESVGQEVTLMVSAIKIRDDKGIHLGVVLVFDDALEKIKAQRVAAWKEVARRIAHEIKNPLTPIKLNAQRLIRRFHDKFEKEDLEVFKTCMESIVTQVDSLRDLVNEFSKFSQLPSVRPKLDNISVLINQVVKFFQMSYPELEFSMQDLSHLPSLHLDHDQINRAFVNIIMNSIASFVEGRKGSIHIAANYLKDVQTVHIEVSDNGCGIPKELRERVLEPYFSTKDGGTGLGLAIVHQIVTEHGGYLRLTENKPFGTTVIIELPVPS